ncbi:hypothetical protein BDU57DRAFT_509031 [Ampelomyces quisqualis]|uniref:Uncharacterized protein n=1 Tax=Ampelomyces quisqualis TaxID=50730 RepID=A0A6A5R0K8_AMPQU|nr:hypothetical protein BDU57DRAFT_509031 [Ampelomyces quisqualis]
MLVNREAIDFYFRRVLWIPGDKGDYGSDLFPCTAIMQHCCLDHSVIAAYLCWTLLSWLSVLFAVDDGCACQNPRRPR